MKMCWRIPVTDHGNRKAWLEKQNAMIKRKCETPEPSLIGSSLFSNNISLKSLSDVQGDFSYRNPRGRATPSRILYDDMNPELSGEDKKILKLMALRREAAMKEEEMAHSVRNLWAEEKRLQAKHFEERKKCWNEYIARKRKTENLEYRWRRKNQIDALNEEKILLESRINEKHERIEKRKMEISAQKKKKSDPTSWLLDAARNQLKKQQEWEQNAQDALKVKYYQDRARRAEEKLKLVWCEKMRRIKEASLRRDIKWQAAKDARDEMKRKVEETQREEVKREEACQMLREHRVVDAVEWKKRMALEKNQMKKEYHALMYNKVKQEEREKGEQARMHLQEKEERMKSIKERKEKAILRSRSNSRAAANLREKIRSTYNL